MRDRNALLVGVLLVGMGAFFLLGNVLHINIWALLWPLALIALGAAILLRPRLAGAEARGQVVLLGDLHRYGDWQVAPEEAWVGIGDVDLDLTHAVIPAGETVLGVRGLIGDVELVVPQGVGLAVNAGGLIGSVKEQGREHSIFLTTYRYASDDYETAERRVKIETGFLIGDVKIRRV